MRTNLLWKSFVVLAITGAVVIQMGCRSGSSANLSAKDCILTKDKSVRNGFVLATNVLWGGVAGDVLTKGLNRLTQPPFDKDFILADVNFNQERRFTHFSGDISGRFIEVTSEISSRGRVWPDTLPAVLNEITQYQKPDGHYGKDIDWSKPIDFNPTTDQVVMMPALWGNGRLLLGLTAAAEKFRDPKVLESAKKLGNFYVNTVYPRFCDSNKLDEYKQEGQYASAYVTCVFEGMEGLINLYQLTGDKKYLDTAVKFADFHEQFDVVPVGHSHGSVGQTGMLVRLYEATGNEKYLNRALARWELLVKDGYVNPAGSILEKLWVSGYNRDEGCTEGDWLRLNLLLWKCTGQTKYLDMAERLYWNGIIPNQWPSGGFGHRFMGVDEKGAYAYLKPSQESLWCCSFHIPWALNDMNSYLVVGTSNGIYYNFVMPFNALVNIDRDIWEFSSHKVDTDNSAEIVMDIGVIGERKGWIPPIHLRIPDWAQDLKVTALCIEGDKENEIDSLVEKDSSVEGRRIKTVWVPNGTSNSKSRIVYRVVYTSEPFFEDRRFNKVAIEDIKVAANEEIKTVSNRLNEVVIRQGPYVFMNIDSGDIQDIAIDEMSQKMVPYVSIPSDKRLEPHAFVCNLILNSESPIETEAGKKAPRTEDEPKL